MHKHKKNIRNNAGFTLIELLVVIFILGILATLLITNMQGARQRARDTSRKTGLNNLKTALRLYYNDYQAYPATDTGIYIPACGANGDSRCPAGCEADFAAGGAGGCDTTYMREVVENFRYYSGTVDCGDDDFRLKIDLENLSDPEIANSQARCPEACGATYDATNEYILCAE
ncbi:MAG: type II secretion system protein [Candidatus Pacebacteria bacterium]|jgi:prepilin-type N-terminal cleavage/methylation domain-containing protein|nr:type II secretion system protein [Candidatus Paceibacterota bacterium]MBT3511807.1 type II secretion system protein [Candidatus Paceibacterota bacterium]MBT4358444.1 type II secretion system protein [Candidatus Paceibacterota bacterium]MBT4680561.1 type II secretion system protein [Candidatus Paceibacterota bacterium]MBT6898753.1 type II secretion system protein [Candidatus Paceibacterota bacterium]